MRKGKIFGICFFLTFALFAEEEKKQTQKPESEITVVVTATRTKKKKSEVGKSMEIIDHKEIESHGYKTLSEALVNSVGIFINRNGGVGTSSGVYLRGSKTEQILVMIDGIEINEPMGLGRSAQMEQITFPGIDHIEIIRGPASTLFGSDASAGVINIITKKPGLGKGVRFYLEGGSFETYQERAEFYLGKDRYFANFAVNNFSTQGISSADERLGNKERDGHQNLSFSLNAGVDITKSLKLNVVGRASQSETELDAINSLSGLPEDDPNYKQNCFYYLAGLKLGIDSDNFKQKLNFQYANLSRSYKDEPDELHPNTSMDGQYLSYYEKASWQGELIGDVHNTLIFGIEYQEEAGKSEIEGTSDFGPYQDEFKKKSLITRSGFLFWDFHYPKYGFVAGARADHSSQFGGYQTGEFSGYFQPFALGPRFRLNLGTGFKSPSLYQLYGTMGGFQVGNPELEPEESWSWEIGLEQELFEEKIQIQVDYFNTLYANLIEWDNLSYSYQNIARAKAKGWEGNLQVKPLTNLRLGISYTFVDARDAQTGEKLIRRWGEKYGFEINWRPIEKLELNLWGIHRGKTEDQIFEMFTEKRVELDPYTVVNASINWRIWKSIKLNFRAENIFDEKYYEVYGYGTIPQTFYLGISYNYETEKGY